MVGAGDGASTGARCATAPSTEAVLPLAQGREHRDLVGQRPAGPRRRRGEPPPEPQRAGTDWSRARRRASSAPSAGRGRGAAARVPGGPRVRRCRARRRARSADWTACTRAHSRPACCPAVPPACASECAICAGVPSNSRPQPPPNSVSPTNATGAPATTPAYAMCPAVCPGTSMTSSASSSAGHARDVAVGQRLRASADRLPRRAEHRHGESRQQRRDAADVVAVVMGDEYRRQPEALAIEVLEHRVGIAGVDDGRVAARAQQPNVVVAEGGDRDNRRHGRIVATAGGSVNDARRLVRHAARTLSAHARAGAGSTGRSPTSSAITRSRSACPSTGSSRRAGSRRAGPSTPSRRRSCAPTRTGCRFPRTRSTSSCCRTRSSSPTSRTSCCARSHRALRPEGQIVIAGFNPFTLFGAKRYFGRETTPPWNGSFIALYRLKDWLALLGFEVTGGSLDCYVPPFAQATWLRRCGFFERPAIAGGRSPGASTSCARPSG